MIVFDPLWETMKRRGISQYTLNDLCRILQCDVADVIRYIPEK